MTKMGKKKKKGLVAALSVVAVIVLLAAAYGIFCLIIEDDKIWADASINGVNIQGMSKKEAAQRNFPMMCSRLWPIQMRWKELYRHPAFRITTPCRILHMK